MLSILQRQVSGSPHQHQAIVCCAGRQLVDQLDCAGAQLLQCSGLVELVAVAPGAVVAVAQAVALAPDPGALEVAVVVATTAQHHQQ